MATDARDDVAAQQAALLAALDGEGPWPEGIDPARLQLVGEGLRGKRARAAARAWPALARALGDGFGSEFARHVAETPLAAERGPLADGLRLYEALRGDPRLDAAARIEALRVRLWYVMTPEGVQRQRGPGLAFARLPRGIVLGVRWGSWSHLFRWGR